MKRFALVGAWLACATAAAWGQDVKVETVVGGLTNPCGVAVQPETGVVFISDSGAGRVVRVVDGKLEPVITGIPKDVYGKGPMYDIGPLGLVFLDKTTLAVGDGGMILRFDGTTWTKMTSNVSANLHAVWGTSPTNVYAVGDNATILHYSP